MRKIDECREARVRLAFRLQKKHDIAVAEIVGVMGCSEKQYLHWLKGIGLDENALIKPSAADTALQRLQSELNKLIDAEELPEKGKAEALMALAKAVKTVGELATETGVSEVEDDTSKVSLVKVRQALARIDRRINELAKRHARELLGRGLDAKSDNGTG
ncbi:hypothetical protein ACFQ3K_04820 [Brucella gallinifaecis]|uniref:Uncharacterized protein n=1 Tax=Brucella gallinifaecis TaxID=215590 RepID=A0A502BSU5_9HYPH|nr:hypothetical protein [Brucella gallinifaecis]TPF76073.1 hypothetical protein FHY56_05245 [Brucella gallinifaecis]